MKRFFMCDWFFIAKCIGHYGLDFVLANVLLAGWLLAACCFCFLFPFPFSFYLFSSHFIPFHPLSSVMLLQEMKWISIWKWISGKRNQRKNQKRMKNRRRIRRRIKRKNHQVFKGYACNPAAKNQWKWPNHWWLSRVANKVSMPEFEVSKGIYR